MVYIILSSLSSYILCNWPQLLFQEIVIKNPWKNSDFYPINSDVRDSRFLCSNGGRRGITSKWNSHVTSSYAIVIQIIQWYDNGIFLDVHNKVLASLISTLVLGILVKQEKAPRTELHGQNEDQNPFCDFYSDPFYSSQATGRANLFIFHHFWDFLIID